MRQTYRQTGMGDRYFQDFSVQDILKAASYFQDVLKITNYFQDVALSLTIRMLAYFALLPG